MKVQVLFLLLILVAVSKCHHLILGDTVNKQLIHHTQETYSAFPFLRRTKNYFFNSPDGKIIRSMFLYDNLNSEATATITAGGIGYTYVNFRFESEKGKGLDFDVGIYS